MSIGGRRGSRTRHPVPRIHPPFHEPASRRPPIRPGWSRAMRNISRPARFKPDVVELGVTNERIAWLRGPRLGAVRPDPGPPGPGGRRTGTRRRSTPQSWILTHYMMSDPERLEAVDGLCRGGGGRRRSGRRGLTRPWPLRAPLRSADPPVPPPARAHGPGPLARGAPSGRPATRRRPRARAP